jgi:uncharacterized protein (DUF58 family)
MVTPALTSDSLLPERELARIARIIAPYLEGRRPSAAGLQTMHRPASQGMDFLDFREYQPGDDSRFIDWRASARGGVVKVRRYCSEVASDWYLCVDASASMGIGPGDNRLLARKLAATLSYMLLQLGHRVGVLLFSGGVDAACGLGRGNPQYARILKTLQDHHGSAAGGGSELGACAAVVGQRHPLVVISDFLALDSMVPALAHLRASRRQLHLFQLDALPLRPERDFLLLEDVETGERTPCGDAASAHSTALESYAQMQQQLSQWSGRYRVPHSLCHRNDNWRELLLRHFTGS